MRILFVDHTAALGGAELSLLDIARHFKDDAEVALFEEGPFADRLRGEGISTTVLQAPHALRNVRRDGGPLASLAALPAMVTLAIRLAGFARRADVLYANSQKAFVAAAFAAKLARRPLIWHLRDILSREHFSGLNVFLATRLANVAASGVIANSGATAAAFETEGGRRGLVTVIPNGIDAAPFDDAREEAAAVRQALGVEGVPVVGVFGRLSPWKGQHVLLEALAELPGVHALVVGSALFGEDDYARGLREQAERLGVASRVHFLGFRDDVPTLMAACDVVVHTSIAPEPFGRVIVEAMLARTPVVAARAGGAAEIIEDGVSGILTAPGNAEDLASALRFLLSGEREITTMVERAQVRAVSRFGMAKMLQDATDVLEGLDGARP